MTELESRSNGAYPYITRFKAEPFRSFALTKRRNIKPFYISQYQKVAELYDYYNGYMFDDNSLNLENLYWFLILRKYLKEEKRDNKKQIVEFIRKCEVHKDDRLGFRFSPFSQQKKADIWSTYFAIACLKLVGGLKEYLMSKGQDQMRRQLKRFILAHKKSDHYLHCLDKHCDICKKTTPPRTLYFVFELLLMLGVEIRNQQSLKDYVGSRKKDPSIVFQLLCLKFLDIDSEVSEKELQYVHDFQKENGGYSFKKINGRVNTTFWVIQVFDNYLWLMDYNPIGIFSFLTQSLKELLERESDKSLIKLMELSKLIILHSTVWKKFIEEIERVIFKELEKETYMSLAQITNTFGLTHGIEEVVSYVNRNYTVNLKILDNSIEFKHFLRNLSEQEKIIIEKIHNQIQENSVVPLSDIFKKFKENHKLENLELKEDILPILKKMIEQNFFKGRIVHKRKFFSKNYLLYVDFYIQKVLISDTEINFEQIMDEKEKLKEHRNNIYNMILKLKSASNKTKEEIDSYLLINEITIAKERIKYLIHNTLMEAEFLNENIEQSFNEELYYINLQESLSPEINQWKKQYLILKNRLRDLEQNLQVNIEEKEELRRYNNLLDELENKIFEINNRINKDIDSFRKYFREILEKDYNENNFGLLIEEFDRITKNVERYDEGIYKISQRVIPKEQQLTKKHKKVIDNWIGIKEEFEDIKEYYYSGFSYFNKALDQISEISKEIQEEIRKVSETTKNMVEENKFQEAFDSIKEESEKLLDAETGKIKSMQKGIKKEMKKKQRLYLLFKHLQEKLETVEEKLVGTIVQQEQDLKEKVIEERNRAIIEDFDEYVSHEIKNFKAQLNEFRSDAETIRNISVKEIKEKFDEILGNFKEADKTYSKKLDECKKVVENFDEKSNLTIIQWDKFVDYFHQELEELRSEYINNIITTKINHLSNEQKTNNIRIADLKKELNLKCNVIMKRIKSMIEISKINGKLYEKEKCVTVYTEYYYKNQELRNFIDKKLSKFNTENVGKVLALYDSSIRNGTLSINMLELQNRINDLSNFEEILKAQFSKKVDDLSIDISSRKEYMNTKEHFENILEENRLNVNEIKENLKSFNSIQNFFTIELNALKIDLVKKISKIQDEIEKSSSHEKPREVFEKNFAKFEEKLETIQEKIEEYIEDKLDELEEGDNLEPELREIYVKKKNMIINDYKDKREKIQEQINLIKDESYRGQLLKYINKEKIHLSQLLGTLQARVEDDIEIKEFRRAKIKIQKRADNIENEIKDIVKQVQDYVKKFNKKSKNFATKNKYILDNFDKFIKEFKEILREKIKTLEQLIVREYILMSIKAVANQYLTISFLNDELKIKKERLKDHLIFLISAGKLPGKYDPRLGIYYENTEVINNLNEEELEVIKKMNFRVYMFLTRLKNFTRQYGSVIAFFAAVLSISYSMFQFTGGNPIVIALPVISVLVLVSYFFFKNTKEDELDI